MQLTIVGGGGFRIPLVYGALLRDDRAHTVTDVVLYDVDPARLRAITTVLHQMAVGDVAPPAVRTTTSLDEALTDAAFVFSAIRVDGLEGRVADEQIPLELGLLGQETTGSGGIAYGLRTIPVASRLAERIALCCPDAWVINFTNPAGMITEAMQHVLGERVIGICDSPGALVRRAARAAGVDANDTTPDYVGLNHLGWLRGLFHGGRDVLPDLLADDAALSAIEEVELLGCELVRALAALPNEYLYYYYFTREAVAAVRGCAETRAEFLLSQQRGFYEGVSHRPDAALHDWQRARRERSASYMAETRTAAGAPQRTAEDVEDDGYERVAVDLMSAIAHDEPTLLILNVRNGSTITGLPADAVVEVPSRVDAHGARPVAMTTPDGHMLGLMQQVKYVEQLTIRAARTGSRATARAAFALHPLVDSAATADVLLDRYCARIPGVANALSRKA